MAEFKFSCPQCGQSIQCDERWSGQQLPCPSCQTLMIVPTLAAEPEPAPVAAPPAPPADLPPPRPQPQFAAVRKKKKEEEESGWTPKKIIGLSLGAVAFCVCFYFGLGVADKWQKGFNEKAKQAQAKSDGGEVGHILALNDMLDRTEPEKMGLSRGYPQRGGPQMEVDMEEFKAPPDPGEKLAVVPGAYTLEVDSAQIPDGRANGTMGATNFVIKAAALKPAQGMVILNLRQGDAPSDPAFFIYLALKPGESNAEDHVWKISRDMKGRTVPQVVKKSQPNPKFAPVQKSFSSGYAMQLELGTVSNSWIPGRIFLALPDADKTFVAGRFYIESASPEPNWEALKHLRFKQR